MVDSEDKVNCDNVKFTDPSIPNIDKYTCIFEKDEVRKNDGGEQLSDIEKVIVEKQKILFEKVNEFNEAYSCHVRKYYNDNSEYTFLNTDNVECDFNNDDHLAKARQLQVEISALETEIRTQVASININGDDFFPSGPDMNSLQSIHNKIKRDRNDLDTKVKELNEGSNTSAKLAKLELDTTVYFSLLWTTLAGCVIFYSLSEL